MKTVMIHDDLIEGVNYFPDTAEVIPAGGSTRQGTGTAAAQLRRLCADAQAAAVSAKLDRAAELMARVTARRSAPIQAHCPGPAELAAQWRADYEARAAQVCAEAKAAYDARNPHKRKEAQM